MKKTVLLSLSVTLFTLTGSWRVATADDGELPSVEDLSAHPEVFLPSEQRKKDCARIGDVCLFADGRGTIAGVDIDPTVGIVTTLARGTQVATLAVTDQVPEPDTWHVELVARFRTRTAGDQPVIVAVMDYADPEGMAKKEATAVWQVDGAATKALGMRVALSEEDGFQRRHTYLVRMVQDKGAYERILAEGRFLLE